MRFPLRLVLLLGLILVANLPASTVLTCGMGTAALSGTGCYSLANFATTETINWQTTFGTAQYNNADNSGAQWVATSASAGWAPLQNTASNLGVTATLLDPQIGSIVRYDDAANAASSRTFNGMFGLGDNLLGVTEGALELQFNRGISGALFQISNYNSSIDMTATIAAYSEANPSAFSVPIMTYRIDALGGSGYCTTGAGTCDFAPYLGIETGMLNVHSLVISTNSAGFYIDSLFVDEAPEPGTFALTGVIGLLALLGRRRMLRDRRS